MANLFMICNKTNVLFSFYCTWTLLVVSQASMYLIFYYYFVYIFFAECAGHSFAYVAPFVFLRDDWIRTQRTVIANRHATNLAIHLPT